MSGISSLKSRITLAAGGTALSLGALVVSARPAAAECDCVAVAAEVSGSIQAAVAKADGHYVRGEFAAAAAAYLAANAKAPDAELRFAAGMALWKAGDVEAARAQLAAYVEASGTLAFRARAERAIDEMDGNVIGGVGAGATAAVAGAGGLVGGLGGTAVGAIGAVGDAGVGASGGVTGAVDRPKPKKLAKGAAVLLGIVAVGAVGAVGIHGIAAGIKDDIEFDTKFGLGMGLSGAVVGGTAIYLHGLTAATGAAAAAPCLSRRPLITPTISPDGAGLAAVGSF